MIVLCLWSVMHVAGDPRNSLAAVVCRAVDATVNARRARRPGAAAGSNQHLDANRAPLDLELRRVASVVECAKGLGACTLYGMCARAEAWDVRCEPENGSSLESVRIFFQILAFKTDCTIAGRRGKRKPRPRKENTHMRVTLRSCWDMLHGHMRDMLREEGYYGGT